MLSRKNLFSKWWNISRYLDRFQEGENLVGATTHMLDPPIAEVSSPTVGENNRNVVEKI
jgi:hypothetical protein